VRVYVEGEKAYKARPEGRPPRCSGDLAIRLTRQAYRAGVPISAGTDGDTPRTDPWPALYEELEILSERVGMGPMGAIRAATAVAARALGQEQEMGTIEAGKLANVMFVAANPLEDIDHLKTLKFTVKRGRRYDRADYRPITAEEMGE
jgi:imidazolonepropionase-like amidohydrolase